MNKDKNNAGWSYIISSKNIGLISSIKELFQYRDLLFLLVRRDFVAYYKQTVLGPLWYLLQPLFTTFVFTIIFGQIAKISTDGIPQILFYLSGTIVWQYFLICVTYTSNTFMTNQHIFGKVYFPRLIIPISSVISNLVTFFIQFMLFCSFFIYFLINGLSLNINEYVIFTPIIILLLGVLGFSFGIFISSITIKYRDIQFLVGFGMQLWMYLTPIVYPISQVPEHLEFITILNPIAPLIESFRFCFFSVGEVKILSLISSVIITLLMLFISLKIFIKAEKTFMDKI